MRLLLLVTAALGLSGCPDAGSAQRTILAHGGDITAFRGAAFEVSVYEGELVQISLAQTDLDVYLQLSSGDQNLGRYESTTGRFGEERVQLRWGKAGTLKITIGADQDSNATGRYLLTVVSGGAPDSAELDFTKGSRVDLPESPAKRVMSFERAARTFACDGRVREEGLAALAALTLITETASDAPRAILNADAAVAAFQKNGERALLAEALRLRGFVHGESENERETTRNFSEAHRIFKEEKLPLGTADVLLSEAVIAFQAGKTPPKELLPVHLQVIEICAARQDRPCEAAARTNAAVSYRDDNNYPEMVDNFDRALKLIDPVKESAVYAQVSDNAAFGYRALGNFDRAIELHQEAMTAFERFGECSGIPRSQYGVGYSLLGIGDHEQALRYFQLALEKRCRVDAQIQTPTASLMSSQSIRQMCAQAGRASTLDKEEQYVAQWIAWDLGKLASTQSDPELARVCHEIAAQLGSSMSRIASAKFEIARDLLDLKRVDDAAGRLDQGIKDLATVPEPSRWSIAHRTEIQARLLEAQGKTADALSRYGEAAALYQEPGVLDFAGVFGTRSRRALLAVAAGDANADEFFSDADAALENVRRRSKDPAFSASLFASGRSIYGQWIESILSREKDKAGTDTSLKLLAISERSRTRLLAEVASGSKLRFLAAKTSDALESREAGRSSNIGAEAQMTSEPADVGTVPKFENLHFDDPALGTSIATIERYRRSLDEDIAVVEFLLGTHRSHAWILRRDGIQRVDLQGADVIRAAVSKAHLAIERELPDADTKSALGRLHELLWKPLQASLSGTTVRIVADDVLYEVPFSALWDVERSQFLVERMYISYLPSIQFAAARAAEKSVEGRPEAALLVGDPVYELQDARQRCSPAARARPAGLESISLHRIPESADEIGAIQGAFNGKRRQALILTGCAASRTRVLDSGLGNFRFIHFATHATADNVIPQRSAIYLSEWNEQGNEVEPEITAMDLLDRKLQAELVVLSGCSTARGRRFSGEGSLGLSFSMVASGSQQVISTLWPVTDQASVVVMSRFYEGLIGRDESAISALRAAQRNLLTDKLWNHPRHWAAYSLLGT